MSYDVSFILDGLILVFLAVSIFYGARLSLFFKVFREGRDGMQILIRDLSVTINKAEASVQVMKEHAKLTELEIRDIIKEAQFLSDELRFMNETGDSLANRLEKLADRNRELVDLMENAGGIGTQRIVPLEEPQKRAPKSKKQEEEPYRAPVQKKKNALNAYEGENHLNNPFEINDFEIDDDDEKDFLALSDGAYRDEDLARKSKVNTEAKSKLRSFAIFDKDHGQEQDEALEAEIMKSAEHLPSLAEQELYAALQRKKKVSELS